jgi:protein phosphatase
MKIDIIGDIHGCYDELIELLEKLGYTDHEGVFFNADGRTLAFLGDLTDRGPESIKVIELVTSLVNNKAAVYTPGNHCNKLYRYFLGNKVQISHGLETTVAELEQLSEKRRRGIQKQFMELYERAPMYLQLDGGKLIIAHAGIREDYIGQTDKKVQTFVLYGDITGEKLPDGRPVRRDWAKKYHGNRTIVYGHTPVHEVRAVNQTYNIDTGCVFGGKLTALRYPEMEIVQVPSRQPYVPEKFTNFD